MHELTWSMLCPISNKTSFRMEIFGALPSQEEVQRIRTAIETSLLLAGIHVMPVPTGVQTDLKPLKIPDTTQKSGGVVLPSGRKLKDLGPCPIHGNQPDYKGRHATTNRCIQCAEAHVANIRKSIGKTKKPPVDAPPPPRRRELQMVWSEVQASCLKCGDHAMRYHRSAVLLNSRPDDFWVHDRPSPFTPCVVNIYKNPQIKDDPEFDPEEEIMARD